MSGQRELVLASAGSGKTYRISSRIIALLAAGVPPRTLFASTFTRKAAGEILGRVLRRLAEGASHAEAAADLSKATGQELDAPGWRTVLARTMGGLHELDVSTLDAFFGRAVRSFGHELGLPAGWRMADEPTRARIRAQALEAVLDQAGTAEMAELVRGMRGGEARWSVHAQLEEDVEQILQVHRDLDPEAPGWDALEVALADTLELRLDGDPEAAAEAEVAHRQALVDELMEADLARKANGEFSGHWVNARKRLVTQLQEGDWDGIVGGSFASAGAEGGQYYRADYPDDLAAVMVRILDAARTHYARGLVVRARAMGRLAAAYETALDAVLRETGTLGFDDVTRLLAHPDGVAGREELGYRLDGGIRHLLLDEFQDTSLLQWKALRPLTDRLFAPGETGRSASVVADPKQSIYGWRGAAPVIVDALARRYEPELDTLEKSYRSSPAVLEAVNHVFPRIRDASLFAESEDDQATIHAWMDKFTPHTAAFPERRGFVALEAGPPRVDGKDIQPEFLAWAADRIAELHRAAPHRSLGVLVGRVKILARLIVELQGRGIPASEEGGTRLVDSPAVVSVLALLRLADHPGNTLARYHVARTPLGELLEYTDAGSDREAVRVSRILRRRLVEDGYGETLTRLRDRLAPALGERDRQRMEQLIELGHAHDPWASLRVDEFVQLAESHRVEAAGDEPVRIMTVWGAKGLEFDTVVLPDLDRSLRARSGRSNPPLAFREKPTDPVTHAYPYVNRELRALFEPVVPQMVQAHAQLRASQLRDELSGLYVAMTRPRHALHLLVPGTGDHSPNSAGKLLREILDGDPEAETTVGQLLWSTGSPDWAAAGGEPSDRQPDDADRHIDDPPDRIRLATDRPRRRLLERRRPSDHGHEEDAERRDGEAGAAGGVAGEDGQLGLFHQVPTFARGAGDSRNDPGAGSAGGTSEDSSASTPGPRSPLDDVLPRIDKSPDGLSSRVRGSVVHGWMEAVEWLDASSTDSGLPSEETRRALARREASELDREFLDEASAELWDWLHNRLQAQEIRAALTRRTATRRLAALAGSAGGPGADGTSALDLVVENELPFLLREGDALVEGIIDRLVLARDPETGAYRAAHVLDYKTDAVPAGDPQRLDERTALYAPQLRAYRRAVTRLYGIPAEAIRLTLLFLEPGQAVDVA